MPKGCGCAGATCGCLVQGAPNNNISVTGGGSKTDPYLIGVAIMDSSGVSWRLAVTTAGVLSAVRN